MVYTTIPTQATGDLVTAANANEWWKANFDFISDSRYLPLSLAAGAIPESITGAPLDVIESSGASPQVRRYALRFDDSADEGREWRNLICPPDYVGTPTLRAHYHMDGANTSDQVTLVVKIAAISDGDASVEAKDYGSANIEVVNVPNDADEHDVVEITLTNTNSLTAGDSFNVLLYRDGDATEAGADDDAVGDMIVTGLEFGYAFT